MKYFIDQDQFVITRDGYILAECCPETALYFPVDSDFVKTIIEKGLANVSLDDLVREHIEKQFSRQLQDIISVKEQLYETAGLILKGLQDGDEFIVKKMDVDQAVQELTRSLVTKIKQRYNS